jgi:hypothetical protein
MFCIHCGASGAKKFCATCGAAQTSESSQSNSSDDGIEIEIIVAEILWTETLQYDLVLRQPEVRRCSGIQGLEDQ